MLNFYAIWKDLQKYWAYLLPIFEQKDISSSMPDEYATFVKIDEAYRKEMTDKHLKNITYRNFCKKEVLQANVSMMMRSFEYLMKCLIKYLEAKRIYFPRLFFLSNE